jgi:hypothetical protein
MRTRERGSGLADAFFVLGVVAGVTVAVVSGFAFRKKASALCAIWELERTHPGVSELPVSLGRLSEAEPAAVHLSEFGCEVDLPWPSAERRQVMALAVVWATGERSFTFLKPRPSSGLTLSGIDDPMIQSDDHRNARRGEVSNSDAMLRMTVEAAPSQASFFMSEREAVRLAGLLGAKAWLADSETRAASSSSARIIPTATRSATPRWALTYTSRLWTSRTGT